MEARALQQVVGESSIARQVLSCLRCHSLRANLANISVRGLASAFFYPGVFLNISDAQATHHSRSHALQIEFLHVIAVQARAHFRKQATKCFGADMPCHPPRHLLRAGYSNARAMLLSRCAATALATAMLLTGPPPQAAFAADGFDEALRLCPDEKVTCVSSYDAGHFAPPWEYDGELEDVVDAVARVASGPAFGGSVARDDSSAAGVALRVSFAQSKDEAIFWFPRDDRLVQFRSERVDGSLWDGSANKLRMDTMRKQLRLAPAPMVKNRRALPSERLPDGNFQLMEERPYKRKDGRSYGEQGGSEPGRLDSLVSAEGLRRVLFPFNPLSPPAQAVYDDLSDLASKAASR